MTFSSCRLPVVSHAHFVRGLLHFGHAPCEFLVGESEKLLGRVRNHFVGELAHERVAADGIADNVIGGAGARRRRRRGTASATSPSAATTTAASASSIASSATGCCGVRLSRCCGCRPQSRHAFPQEGTVGHQRFIHSPIAFFIPPGEHRIVAVIEGEPCAQGIAQSVGFGGRAIAHYSAKAHRIGCRIRSQLRFRRGSSVRDLFIEFHQRLCGPCRIDGVHLLPRFFQLDDRSGKGEPHSVLRSFLFFLSQAAQFMIELVAEQDVIDFSILRHFVEIEWSEAGFRLFVKALQTRATSRSVGEIVVAKQIAAIGRPAVDDGPHLAGRGVETGRDIGRGRKRDRLQRERRDDHGARGRAATLVEKTGAH